MRIIQQLVILLVVEIPKDANVPGFILVEELDHKFDGKRLAVNLGDINTAHHE